MYILSYPVIQSVMPVYFSTYLSDFLYIYKVHTGFGKLRKLIAQFSWNWKVLEKVFQNGYGRVLDFCLEKF